MAIKLTAAAATASVLVVLFCGLHEAARHGPDYHRARQSRQSRYAPASPAHAVATYRFGYDVKDAHSRYEEGDGRGNVRGSYSLVEPDGSTRVVEYTARGAHGFNAVVSNTAGTRRRHRDATAARPAARPVARPADHSADAAAAAAGYRGLEFLRHSSRPSSYYKFHWLPPRDHRRQ